MNECSEYLNSFEMEIDVLKRLVLKADNEMMRELLENDISVKTSSLNKYKSVLQKISSNEICCRLYAKLLRGKPPTRAVEEVANENYFNNIKPYSISSIWRYYLKIKKLVE